MMCDGCKEIADKAKRFEGMASGKNLARVKHTRKAKPHCEHPQTCTCQHQPVNKGYVSKD